MLHGALEYVSKVIDRLITPELDRLIQVVEKSGFERIGVCTRVYPIKTPSFGGIENINIEYMPFCRASMLRRTSGSEEELLALCDNIGLLYRGRNLEGEGTTLNKKCPYSKDMLVVFSQYGNLDFKVVQPSEIEEYLSTPQLIAASKP